MYNVYPYLYRSPRVARNFSGEDFDAMNKGKRGDLEGYVAADNFASQNYADCTRAVAMANINTLNNLRADMTPKEYINILIKQGQVPDKHFKYRQLDNKAYEITELNSFKEPTKKVVFYPPDINGDTPVVCKYFTPESGRCFKEVRYRKDGTVTTVTDFEDAFDEQSVTNELAKINEVRQAERFANQTVPINNKNPFEKL